MSTLIGSQSEASTIQYHKGVLDPETGWMVTPQEAYLPEEWEEHKRVCPNCQDEFVLYVSDDTDLTGRTAGLCSDECRQEAHRRDSREWARRKRMRNLMGLAKGPRS